MLNVSIINQSPHALPEYQTSGSAGLDLTANLSEPSILQPLERRLIPTGLFISIPDGFEAQIRPRSGTAINRGITMINAPGTIDSDYRGEIKVAIINLSSEVQTIQNGDRIAQMVFAAIQKIQWQPVNELQKSERGEGGFGHTGG